MRYLITILLVLVWSTSFGQLPMGTYSQGKPRQNSYLQLSSNGKFSFHDMRSSSCFGWIEHYGEWSLKCDTLILSYNWSVQSKTDTTKLSEPVEYKKYIVKNYFLEYVGIKENNFFAYWGDFKFQSKEYNW
jgi:hypothetical protein